MERGGKAVNVKVWGPIAEGDSTYAVLGVLRIQQAQINREDKRLDIRANARVFKTGVVKKLPFCVTLVALGEPGKK